MVYIVIVYLLVSIKRVGMEKLEAVIQMLFEKQLLWINWQILWKPFMTKSVSSEVAGCGSKCLRAA